MKDPDKTPEHIKNKHTDDLVDHYWGSINYIFGLIKASEIKAGLILSFYGILLNFIYQNLEAVFTEAFHDVFLAILLGFWVTCTITSIYYSIRCFMPRIEANYDKNIFFFGDVVSKFGTINEFSKTFYKISLNENKLFDQLGQQIFILSKIAALKFKNVNISLRFLALALLFLFLTATYTLVFTFSK